MASTAVLRYSIYLSLGVVALVSGTCYRPDGSAAEPSYLACNGSAPVSMCCHLAYSNNGGDLCGSGSTYGLCGITGTQLWRESCTDPTWTSPSCLNLCIDGAGDQVITACPDGSYCCGSNNATCCNAGQGKFIVNNAVSNTSAVSTSSSSTSSRTSSSTSSTTASSTSTTSPASTPQTAFGSGTTSTSSSPLLTSASNTATASDTGGLPKSAIVGMSVGITAGVILLALLAGFLLWRRKQRYNHLQTTAALDDAGPPNDIKFAVMSEMAGMSPAEMGHENTPHETISPGGKTDHDRGPVELPAGI